MNDRSVMADLAGALRRQGQGLEKIRWDGQRTCLDVALMGADRPGASRQPPAASRQRPAAGCR